MARKKVLTKEDYHKQVDQRMLAFAETLVGYGKPYEFYKDFFDTIDFPIGSLHLVKKGTRHFTMYNVYLCCTIHGAAFDKMLSGLEKGTRFKPAKARV